MTDFAVAGGGLAGLVAARHLADGGHDVVLFEREETVGGRVRTSREDGLTLDRGFQVLFTAYPAVQRELDLDALDLRSFAPGATIARPGHRSVLSDPFRNPRDGLETLFNRDVRTGDKLRTFRLQRELARTNPDEILDPNRPATTIREFLADRGFSKAYVERFVAPFYGGITLDRSLSTDSRVFEYTFKMASEGSTVVPAAGMGAIGEQLSRRAEAAGARIETGREVTAVGDGTVELSGETVDADAVVVATDPHTARELTGVESIPTGAKGCVTQYYTLDSYAELDTGTKLLLNAADDRPNQIAPLSAVAPEYAPEGTQLLSATFLGDQAESDEQLAAETREALSAWYPERDLGGLELRHTDRIEFAQFPQPPGFLSSLPDPDAPDGPVVLAGDYTRWCSIQGALESGRRAAELARGERQ
ncbi:NAD(P)/FAD-dependent oxidoreductase [Halapricum hydrolyticum]|uniref:FAD-dependent oxidoreductase n=1 Tax=Halapricum hydrolyticum TaxID=2979991 RepID=A0AAE3IC41_9EURY|nr:NAD(P)/FAD-dependent oxidoreductase [Halapricum hydrolyticum]MCU4718369.1 FAD-dependent oxidoreductase [Halapricum hydrolyticum]MCU4726518.1 FAD-dependent oxidoreductase [Halapricum hydrolyticum]